MIKTYFQTYQRLLRILSTNQKKNFFLVQGLILLTSIVDILGLALFIPIITLVSGVENTGLRSKFALIQNYLNISEEQRLLTLLFVLAVAFFAFRTVFIIFSNWLQSKFVFSFSERLAITTYDFYLSESYERINRKDDAKIIRELTVSPQHFSRLLLMPLLLLTSELVVMVFITIGIALYDFYVFILIAVTIFPAAVLFHLSVKRKVKGYGWMQHSLTPQLMESSLRGITGIIEVKLKSLENKVVKEYASILKQLNDIGVKTTVIGIIPSKLMELTMIFGLFVIFVYAIYFSDEPQIVLPLIAVYAAAGYRIVPSLSKAIPSVLGIEKFSYLFDLYEPILKMARIISDSTVSKGNFPFKDNISLVNVSYGFIGESETVLKQINLCIKKGEILGIIGRSGSGKSTLVNVVAGLHKPLSGELIIDGVSIDDTNRRQWMRKIGYVHQQPYVERGSLAQNIAFMSDAIDDDRISSILSMTSLDGFVQRRDPKSIKIDERGKNLSGGQKQRIAIARALYHAAELIILDEATSALDVQTENEINETINSLKGTGITVIIVAHRYSTLKYTDRILRLEDGAISEITDYNSVVG